MRLSPVFSACAAFCLAIAAATYPWVAQLFIMAIAVAFFVSTAAEARGGRGFSGGRSFSRPATTKSYAPKRTTVAKKNTTVINQTVNQVPASSNSGFWSTVAGSFAGSMAGNAVYDAVTDDKGQAPVQAQPQPQPAQ